MIRPGCAIAFCAGLGLAWCSVAEAERVPLNSWAISKPDDAIRVDIDDLKDRVKELELWTDHLARVLKGLLPECIGDPPEHLPCIERDK